MRIPRIRRRWFALGLVVVLVAGSSNWRLRRYASASSTVTIRVDAFTFELGPGTAAGYRLDVVVPLDAPLGDRAVIDASSGQEVPAAPLP